MVWQIWKTSWSQNWQLYIKVSASPFIFYLSFFFLSGELASIVILDGFFIALNNFMCIGSNKMLLSLLCVLGAPPGVMYVSHNIVYVFWLAATDLSTEDATTTTVPDAHREVPPSVETDTAQYTPLLTHASTSSISHSQFSVPNTPTSQVDTQKKYT